MRARAMASEALRRGRAAHRVDVAVTAHLALGLAAREEHDLAGARRELEVGVALARAEGLEQLEVRSLVSLASVLAAEGAPARALVELDRAAALDGDAPLVLMQRGTVLQRMGLSEEAERTFDVALAAAREADDPLTEALVLGNRGILLGYGDRPVEADADMAAAEDIFGRLGMELNAADVRHNRGFVAAATGDVARALQHHAAARATYERLGVARPNALLDEARALLEANLVTDAHRAALAAVQALRAAGQGSDLAEALLLLAEASAAAGAPDDAAAAEAGTLFLEQGRTAWSTLAAFTALRLGPAVDPAEARRLSVELEAAGWPDAAVEARLLAATAAAGAGQEEEAAIDLREVAEQRRHGPAARRLRGWYALALLRRQAGDAAGASRAAASGLRIASAHAATELRAGAGLAVEPLVDVGVGIALGAGRPRRTLVWSERWRAGVLGVGAGAPPAGVDLDELRAVMRRLADDSLPTYQRVELDHRRRRLEAEVDRRARAAGRSPAPQERDLDVDALIVALEGRTLVEFVVHEGGVHRISVGAAGLRLHEPEDLAAVVREVRALRLAAGRLARPGAGRAMGGAADAASAALGRLLLGGIPEEDELVLVPSGPLHAVPWPLLPGARSRPVTVTPSARLWLAAGGAAKAPRRALVVTHGVPGGAAEAAVVAACYPEAEVLEGSSATSAAVLAGLATADVAHLAVHATFRADNPRYSSLLLADGPLLVHDLDRLARTPPVVVLAACGAAQSTVGAGDQLLGLTASFLRSGTRSLVASALPVAEELAPPLMAAFHAELQRARPAVALHAATAKVPAHAGAAFTCLGRG